MSTVLCCLLVFFTNGIIRSGVSTFRWTKKAIMFQVVTGPAKAGHSSVGILLLGRGFDPRPFTFSGQRYQILSEQVDFYSQPGGGPPLNR